MIAVAAPSTLTWPNLVTQESGFGSTVMLMLPVPVPEVGALTVIHESDGVAVQVQVSGEADT